MEKSKRYGQTEVTSVSVSPFFMELMKEYDISPTEAFRRGMAVFLYDLGIPQYQSDKNKERSDFIKRFMSQLEKDEKIRQEYENIKKFVWVYDNLSKIKEALKDDSLC